MIEILILRVDLSTGDWTNHKLGQMAEEFCFKEFGGSDFALKSLQHIWVAVKQGKEGKPEVMGIMGCGQRLDMPLFHVSGKSNGESQAISVKMIRRLRDTLLDAGQEGKELMIHCAPEAQNLWKEFFKSQDAKPANRYIITVKPGVEV